MVKVSVIITCYNLERYIARAIHSCMHQTLPEEFYEIIIVDDASTDNSWDVISDFSSFTTTLRNETNAGVAASSNVGIRKAKGDFIVRVDGDDFINKNFLHVMSQVLELNDDIGFVYCDHIVVNEGAAPRKLEINTLDKLLDHGAGVLFRKRYLESIGLYKEDFRNCEDYDLILRYIKNFDGYHLRLPYYRYFKREGSLSSKVEERSRIKKKVEKKNVIKFPK